MAILTQPSCTVDFSDLLSPIRTALENKCSLEKQSMKKTLSKHNVQVGKKKTILEFECYSEPHECHAMVLLLL